MRAKHFRVIRVVLDCGCPSDLFTGRYRVSRDLQGILVMNAVRRGVWCAKCGGKCLPVKVNGVRRA